jgi:hypothetical protein
LPEFDDLVQRALEAQEHARVLVYEVARRRSLAATLREAYYTEATLVRCAWCDSIKADDEWLQLEALSDSQRWIVRQLHERASHGICPICFEAQMEVANRERLQNRAG